MIIVVLIKWHGNRDKSGNKVDITTLKSFTAEPSNEETNDECVFSNTNDQPQDVHGKATDQSDN